MKWELEELRDKKKQNNFRNEDAKKEGRQSMQKWRTEIRKVNKMRQNEESGFFREKMIDTEKQKKKRESQHIHNWSL